LSPILIVRTVIIRKTIFGTIGAQASEYRRVGVESADYRLVTRKVVAYGAGG